MTLIEKFEKDVKITNIMTQKFFEHEKIAKEKFGDRLVFIVPSGSMNYGLADESSDMDSIAVVTPTLRDIAKNTIPKSTTFILDNGEHMEVKDIRLFMKEIKKCNFTFMCFLFTDIIYINHKYDDIFYEGIKFFDNNSIAYARPRYMISCIRGFLNEIAKRPITNKNVYNMGRLVYAYRHYNKSWDFKAAINPEGEWHDLLMELKRSEDKEVLKSYHDLFADTEFIIPNQDNDIEVEELLDTITEEILKRGFEEND